MKTVALIGAQWGDEGKGKITDLLAQTFDIVVRYQGGNNAGHTIWVGDKKQVLHLIPSGILHPHTVSVIAHGVVVAPEALYRELEELKKTISITPDNLKISLNCSIITRYHQLLDQAREQIGPTKIGTTGKGIGPCYEDKAGRRSVKFYHLLDQKELRKRLSEQLDEKALLFEQRYHISYPSVEEECERLYALGQILKPYLCDTFSYVEESLNQKKRVLFEGAQGLLLDIDYGSYPYVTSSNTSIAGVHSGCGLTNHTLDGVIGVVKAYVTRVGEGPFPTELKDETGEILQQKGHEFGATTGRKRRCGWLDLPLLRYAIKTAHISHLVITKLDVLSYLPSLKVCYGYEYEGKILDAPYPGLDLSLVKPLFKEFEPIPAEFEHVESNTNLQTYLNYIQEELKTPIAMWAYGPERNQIYRCQDFS